MNPIHDPDANPHRPPPGTALCGLDELTPGAIRRFRFGPYDGGFRGLVMQVDGEVKGYVDWCPHQGIPLQDERDDIFLDEGLIACAWHWARFCPKDGKGVDGQAFEGLHVWAVSVGADGVVRTR